MRLKNLKKNKTYLLALSYGSDSVALFHLLINNGFSFEVAYTNYHLPYTGDIEESKIKELCKKYNKKLYLNEVYYQKGNEENWARIERYNFFNKIIKENKYLDACLIAHNLDDFIETYYLQLNRKGYYSYYGIKKITYKDNVKYIRPLIKIRKKDLEKYNKRHHYDYFVDTSNLEPCFKRNIIRINKVCKLSNLKAYLIYLKIQNINKKKAKERNKYLTYISDDLIELNKICLLNQDEFIILFYTYLSLFPFIKKISKEEIINFYQNLKNDKNIKMKLNNEYYLFKEYGYLKIDKIYQNEYKYELDKNGNDIFKFVDNSSIFNDIFSKYDIVIVKPLKRNEKYPYKGNLKSVSKIFIDMKLPSSYRNIYPGIYNEEDKLLYIPRYKRNFNEKESTFLKFNLKDLMR